MESKPKYLYKNILVKGAGSSAKGRKISSKSCKKVWRRLLGIRYLTGGDFFTVTGDNDQGVFGSCGGQGVFRAENLFLYFCIHSYYS
jgi:hypothetical protein